MALLLWLCWALTPCAQAQGLAAETQSQFARPTPRQVLVLYSLGSDASSLWQTLIRRGMNAELANRNWNSTPGMFEERLDSVRVGERQAVAGLDTYLRTKYANVRLDAIITENYLAARFLSEHPNLFPGVPRFYVNQGRQGWQPDDGTNLDVIHDFPRALAVIAQVTPELRHIAVVGDTSARGRDWIAAFRSGGRPLPGTHRVRLLGQADARRTAPPHRSAGRRQRLYLLPVYRDMQGARVTPPDVARDLAARSAVPIFTSVESLILPGVAGGHVISADKVGRTIARILQGRAPDPAGMQATIFDDGAVQRFGLRNLPAGTRILNQPQGLWTLYHTQIIAGLSLLALQAALIAALVLALRGRRATLAILNEERNKLEERVLRRTLELLVANSKLEQQATTDPLTELGNRRKMTLRIAEEIERGQRFGHALSLLMIDIDHFKRINDHYGHDAGDRAIVAVAQVLRSMTRGMDTAARFGGEEFVLLMPETSLQVALEAAERLRAAIEGMEIDCGDGQTVRLTISIGATSDLPLRRHHPAGAGQPDRSADPRRPGPVPRQARRAQPGRVELTIPRRAGATDARAGTRAAARTRHRCAPAPETAPGRPRSAAR